MKGARVCAPVIGAWIAMVVLLERLWLEPGGKSDLPLGSISCYQNVYVDVNA